MAKINHNDTNLNGLNALMEKRNELMKQRDKANRTDIIKDNLYNWVQSVPEYYRPAKYSLFTQTALIPISYFIKNKQIPFRMIVHGQYQNINNMFLYAVLRYAVAQGILTPSQIRVTTIQEGADAVMGGFQKQSWRDDFFNTEVKLYVILGASKQLTDMNITGTEKFMSMVSDHINNHHKNAFFSYTDNNKEALLSSNGKWVPTISKNKQLIMSLLGQKPAQVALNTSSVNKTKQ